MDTTEWVFQPAPFRRAEFRNRVRTFGEIQQQARRADVEKVFQARVRAMRERNAARRDTSRTSGG